MNLRSCLTLLPLALGVTLSAQSIALNLQSLGSPDPSFIEFTPAGTDALEVTFVPNSAGGDFAISGSNVPSLNSFTGVINGTFAVTGFSFSPTVEQGTVASSNASLVLSDGLGDRESANLWWNTAFTAFHTGGIESFDMNAGSAQNLSGFAYSGAANSVLQQDFAGISSGNVVISFSFASSPNSLTLLAAAPTPTSDSFSGQVSAIPEPSACAAVIGGLAALLGGVLRRRRPALLG